ncbi:hypothetical protein LPJ56_002341 [Coemansia sp. RSA 2599]|nr:hypothetical protein LPJ75_002013 [Coemansia sp. RSA 2598]KAJ1826125.1 hypothetical protein LPJ56_002341 [Coemansia sp. RSA 2599]
MATSFYDQRASRLSLGSNASGSRRHSLLSTDGNSAFDNTYNYADSWSGHGDRLSRWRQTYIASDTGDTEGVQSTSLALPDESRFTTCLAMSEDQPLLAVGSGSYETNMFFVQSLDDQLDVKASFASKFPIYSLAFKANLLMAGTDRNTSVLYHVDRARLLGFASDGGEDGPLVKCVGTYKNKSAKSIDVAAPGNHVPTKRVSCVEFAPAFGSSSGGWPPSSVSSNADLFLSCLGGVVNVWDAGASQHALRIEKVSNQPLTRASWSPQAPASLIAAGGADGVVSILDLRRRGKAVAWRTASPDSTVYGGAWLGTDGGEGSMGGAINDVAWSPYMPYWLATAGEGGCVSLWDLRFAASDGAAVATLHHPTNHASVRSLAWSTTHVDLLSTGSSDKSWWLHSLRVEDCEPSSPDTGGARKDKRVVRSTVVADKRAADDIGSVVSVRAKGSTFYTLSSCGDLYAHRVTAGALNGASVHRMEGADFERAEAAVYARDIRTAAESVLGLVDKLKEESDHAAQAAAGAEGGSSAAADTQKHPLMKYADSIKSLCDLFKVKARVEHSSWNLPPPSVALAVAGSSLADGGTVSQASQASLSSSAEAAHAAFLSDLEYYGYGLPPDFPLESTASRQPLVWQALERLNMSNLRIKLSNMVALADAADMQQGKAKGSPVLGSDGRPLWKSIVDKEKQIVQYVRAEPALFDARLLRSTVKLILPHDCIAGLRLGLGICEAYLANRNASPIPLPESIACAALDGLVHVLLFPTVFDTDTAGGDAGASDDPALAARKVVTPDVQLVRERISECLSACPEVVFEMVRLEIRIQETVLKGGEQAQVAEAIVSAMKEHAKSVGRMLEGNQAVQVHPMYPTTTTLSASAVRLYLNSLVPMRAYDEYLVNTQWWRAPSLQPEMAGDEGHVVGSDYGWLSSYPLARTLNRQTATLVIPRLRRQIDVVKSTIQKEPLSLEPRLYRDTLLKISRINLMMRCDRALTFSATSPSAAAAASSSSSSGDRTGGGLVTTSVASSVLSEAFDEVGHAFLMLLEALTRHTSHRDAYKRAAAEAQPLYESLVLLVDVERGHRPRRRESAAKMTKDIDHLVYDERKAHIASINKYLRRLESYTAAAN